MDSALLVHRLHFAFTITFHYLFPQLTMGLAPLIVVLKTLALRSQDENRRELYSQAARFWARIFGINFVLGVVTGIPMEFQFGTNWSLFSRFAERRDRPDPGHGRRVRGFLSGVVFSGIISLRRKASQPAGALVVGDGGFSGFVAFRFLYHRYRRMDLLQHPVGYAFQFPGVRSNSPVFGSWC